jgi:hypothetical protein
MSKECMNSDIGRCNRCQSSSTLSSASSESLDSAADISTDTTQNNKECLSNFFDIVVNYLRNCAQSNRKRNANANDILSVKSKNASSVASSVASSADSDYIHSISSDENIQNLCIDYEKKITQSYVINESLEIFSISSIYNVSATNALPASSS